MKGSTETYLTIKCTKTSEYGEERRDIKPHVTKNCMIKLGSRKKTEVLGLTKQITLYDNKGQEKY